MAFVYEDIPPEEWPRIKKSLDRYKNWGSDGDDWYIDRDRDIIMRMMSSGHTIDTYKTSYWLLFIKGVALWFTTDAMGTKELSPKCLERRAQIRDLRYPPEFFFSSKEIYHIIYQPVEKLTIQGIMA